MSDELEIGEVIDYNRRLLGEIAALQAKIDEARKVLSTPEGSSTIEYELGKIQRAKVILTSPSIPPPAEPKTDNWNCHGCGVPRNFCGGWGQHGRNCCEICTHGTPAPTEEGK